MERKLNALQVCILSAILWGALGIQVFLKEEPCPLCLLQRLGMMAVAAGGLLNVRFGIRRAHYALSLLASVFGGFVALRQIFLHICPAFPSFGEPFWGLSLYTWSFIVFASNVLFIGLLCLIFDTVQPQPVKRMEWWAKTSFWLIFLAAVGNIFASYFVCGFGLCE